MSIDPPAPDVPRPATAELIALAAAARPDWPTDLLREVLARARYQGMTWGQVLVEIGRMLADPGAEPPDLIAAAPEAWRRRRPSPGADTAHRGAAAARAALQHRPDTN